MSERSLGSSSTDWLFLKVSFRIPCMLARNLLGPSVCPMVTRWRWKDQGQIKCYVWKESIWIALVSPKRSLGVWITQIGVKESTVFARSKWEKCVCVGGCICLCIHNFVYVIYVKLHNKSIFYPPVRWIILYNSLFLLLGYST